MMRTAGRLVAFSLAIGFGAGAGWTAELSQERILRIEAGMHTNAIRRIDTDTAGRWESAPTSN